MPTQEEINDQLSRLQTYRRTLAHYLQQQAQLGKAHIPPSITHGIYEAREHIRIIKINLREWEIVVEDAPDDNDKIKIRTSPHTDADTTINNTNYNINDQTTQLKTNWYKLENLIKNTSNIQSLMLFLIFFVMIIWPIGQYLLLIPIFFSTNFSPIPTIDPTNNSTTPYPIMLEGTKILSELKNVELETITMKEIQVARFFNGELFVSALDVSGRPPVTTITIGSPTCPNEEKQKLDIGESIVYKCNNIYNVRIIGYTGSDNFSYRIELLASRILDDN